MTAAADIYALGLILNESFTRYVPHGTEYQRITAVAQDHAFLDSIVAEMLRQDPSERPASIAAVKGLIKWYRAEAVSLQKLNALRDAVIPAGEVDDPLAHQPPRLIHAEYDAAGILRLTLDRQVHKRWVQALQNMGSYSSVTGAGPGSFSFQGATASIPIDHHSAQAVIDHFKQWLPRATQVLKFTLEQGTRSAEAQRLKELRRAREAEEQRLAVNRGLRV